MTRCHALTLITDVITAAVITGAVVVTVVTGATAATVVKAMAITLDTF